MKKLNIIVLLAQGLKYGDFSKSVNLVGQNKLQRTQKEQMESSKMAYREKKHKSPKKPYKKIH